jgi:hypothetical protein
MALRRSDAAHRLRGLFPDVNAVNAPGHRLIIRAVFSNPQRRNWVKNHMPSDSHGKLTSPGRKSASDARPASGVPAVVVLSEHPSGEILLFGIQPGALARMRAVSRLFLRGVNPARASITAATSARAVFGCVRPIRCGCREFFRMFRPDILRSGAVKPMRSLIARAFHGSPTQKPTMLPMRMFITICGGGTTTVRTS